MKVNGLRSGEMDQQWIIPGASAACYSVYGVTYSVIYTR